MVHTGTYRIAALQCRPVTVSKPGPQLEIEGRSELEYWQLSTRIALARTGPATQPSESATVEAPVGLARDPPHDRPGPYHEGDMDRPGFAPTRRAARTAAPAAVPTWGPWAG